MDGEKSVKISFWSLPRMIATSTFARRYATAISSSAARQRDARAVRSSMVRYGANAAPRWASSSGYVQVRLRNHSSGLLRSRSPFFSQSSGAWPSMPLWGTAIPNTIFAMGDSAMRSQEWAGAFAMSTGGVAAGNTRSATLGDHFGRSRIAVAAAPITRKTKITSIGRS